MKDDKQNQFTEIDGESEKLIEKEKTKTPIIFSFEYQRIEMKRFNQELKTHTHLF